MGFRDGENKDKIVKGNKYSVKREIRSENLMYNTVNIIDNTDYVTKFALTKTNGNI